MDTTRREFLERFTTTAALFGAAPLSINSVARALGTAPAGAHGTAPAQSQQQWDVSWVNRLTGKHKAVFDCPEIESGYGVWRASIWTNQYNEVLGIPPRDMTAVVILRHNGIALAMQQSYWDKYGVGKAKTVMHPVTHQPTDRNPVLLSSSRGEVPAELDGVALDKFLARGGIALACNLALDDCVENIKTKDGATREEARKRAIGYLVPGVILQPSGVFAAIRAQEAGCTYLRAS